MSDFDNAIADLNAATLDSFGEIVSYIQPAALPVPINVVWLIAKDPQIAATAWAPAASFPPGYAKGDTVIRGTKTYSVVGFLLPSEAVTPFPRPDDAGAVTLALRFLTEAL